MCASVSFTCEVKQGWSEVFVALALSVFYIKESSQGDVGVMYFGVIGDSGDTYHRVKGDTGDMCITVPVHNFISFWSWFQP